MITDANDKDWEDFWNSMKERVWTTSDLHNIWTTTDLHAVWEEMEQIRTTNSYSSSISSDSKSVLSYTKQSQREP